MREVDIHEGEGVWGTRTKCRARANTYWASNWLQ